MWRKWSLKGKLFPQIRACIYGNENLLKYLFEKPSQLMQSWAFWGSSLLCSLSLCVQSTDRPAVTVNNNVCSVRAENDRITNPLTCPASTPTTPSEKEDQAEEETIPPAPNLESHYSKLGTQSWLLVLAAKQRKLINLLSFNLEHIFLHFFVCVCVDNFIGEEGGVSSDIIQG